MRPLATAMVRRALRAPLAVPGWLARDEQHHSTPGRGQVSLAQVDAKDSSTRQPSTASLADTSTASLADTYFAPASVLRRYLASSRESLSLRERRTTASPARAVAAAGADLATEMDDFWDSRWGVAEWFWRLPNIVVRHEVARCE